jgi:hypothetical protein
MWREVRHVIEFRGRSWLDGEVAALMSRERIALCQSDAADWAMCNAATTHLVALLRCGCRVAAADRASPADAQFMARESSDPLEGTRTLSATRARQLMGLPAGDGVID